MAPIASLWPGYMLLPEFINEILFSALIKLQVYFINLNWALSNRIILLTSADYEIYRERKEHFCQAVGKILLSHKSQELSKILFPSKNRIT